MKRLFYIFAISLMGAVSVQAASLWVTTFGNAAQGAGTKVNLVNSNSQISGEVTSLQKTVYASGETSDVALLTGGAMGSDASLFVPSVNVQNAGSWEAGMQFTNSSSESYSLTGLKMTVVSSSGTGVAQTVNRSFKLTLDMGGQSVETTVTVTGGSGKNGATVELAFDRPVTWNAGTDLDLLFKASQSSETAGSFLGIKSMEFMGELLVPEPATASLSLLGLGVLMMRRRRL